MSNTNVLLEDASIWTEIKAYLDQLNDVLSKEVPEELKKSKDLSQKALTIAGELDDRLSKP